jgi:hypothetical protein
MNPKKQVRVNLSEKASAALIALHDKYGKDFPITHLANMIVLSAESAANSNNLMLIEAEQDDTTKPTQ